ncbi:D-glycero-alpha-D-manno-heptose-1,7-bisphosphate 7-phosphatase [Cohaesibacter gelatinilyticus]|uniref:D,D-heptose 1,7-bisphosphate phosphatase n=1 Tax=Cohaesibacter gelatinilyticus TaxID=372072 RepID=A0A285NHU4_9HYPH|nr:HAD-IIIA family hydrolase [Cohaesibacter gelatinilyticus]SNZ08828.1 D-glycero-D-manno-heptose 1,7-bisphosphate phosphatase [Cohaesibacter gelatinilyticus]
MSKQQYLIFLDRDGTLIHHIPYLCDPEHVQLLPGVKHGLKQLKAAGHLLFLHTNQSGVGRGYFPLQKAVECNNKMLKLLDDEIPLFEEICIAPEHPDKPQIYRKPSPKFALEMCKKYSVLPDRVIYVGDTPSDLLAAKNAGGTAVGVNTGDGPLRDKLRQQGLDKIFTVFDSFEEAVHYLLSNT